MTVEDIGTSEITVRITNKSGEDFSYGEYFSLQKQIDGQWYTIPVRADNVGFQDIANILPDGESASETYNLDIYGWWWKHWGPSFLWATEGWQE